VQVTKQPIHVPDSGRAQRLCVSAGACSVQGVRRDTNEDSQYISPEMTSFIVADGMGGHAAGEVASKFAVDVLSHDLTRDCVANLNRTNLDPAPVNSRNSTTASRI
jgi:serine/threonine protein phosphatase PrpC